MIESHNICLSMVMLKLKGGSLFFFVFFALEYVLDLITNLSLQL